MKRKFSGKQKKNFKKRKASSYKKTAYKKTSKRRASKYRKFQKKNVSLDDLHSGSTEIAIKCVMAKPIKGAMGYPTKYNESQYGGGAGATGGIQAIANFPIGTVAQWMTAHGTGYNNTQSYANYFSLNPQQLTSGSALWSPASFPANDKFVLVKTETLFAITNYSGASQFVDIYVLKCKNDTVNSPTVEWNLSYVADNFNGAALTLPGTASTASLGGAGLSSVVGAKPTDTALWKDFWQIKKVHHLTMGGGASERIKFDIVHNYVGHYEKLQENQNLGIVYPKGCTVFMVVYSGQVVEDTGLGATSSTFATPNVGIILEHKHQFKCFYGSGARSQSQYAVSNIPQTTNATQNFISVVDTALLVPQV